MARDFVEFPSQVHEHWLRTPEVLNRFLVNARGRPMPPELVAKLHRAAAFNAGFSTVETLASTIVDMKIHLATDPSIDPKAFETTTLAEIGMPREIVMRHRLPHFGHIFSGEGYAAGYYSYLWAEVLDQDAYEAFTETGNPYDPATAKRFHDNIMSVGNTVDPALAFRNFRGREPSVDASASRSRVPGAQAVIAWGEAASRRTMSPRFHPHHGYRTSVAFAVRTSLLPATVIVARPK